MKTKWKYFKNQKRKRRKRKNHQEKNNINLARVIDKALLIKDLLNQEKIVLICLEFQSTIPKKKIEQ